MLAGGGKSGSAGWKLGDDARRRDDRRSSKGASRGAQAAAGTARLRRGSAERSADSRPRTYEVLDRVAGDDRDDATLARVVEAAQSGDDLAFAELYVRTFDRVRRYLAIALKNEQDAQEVAQDVFAKLLVSLESFDPARGEFRTWLFSVVRRMALDHLRRAKRSDELVQQIPCAPERVETFRERFDPTLDVAAVVESLPATQRRVVVLRFAFDFTPSEIAEVVGASVDAVRHTQHRALKAIAARLQRADEAVPA